MALLLARPEAHEVCGYRVGSPRFDAVVELYRDGVRGLSYEDGRLRLVRRSPDREAQLQTWPNGAFSITSGDREEVFLGDSRRAKYVLPRGAAVTGWMGEVPIVHTDRGNRLAGRGGLNPLPKLLTGAENVVDIGSGALLAVRPSALTGSDEPDRRSYFLVQRGKSTPFTGIGDGDAQFQVWTKGVLAVNETRTDIGDPAVPSYGDIWLIGQGGSFVKRIFHRRGVDLSLGKATNAGEALVTALGYDGRTKKFHDYSTLYRLSADEKLTAIVALRGEVTFYGLDRTRHWVIATRWHGYEMGAYDLVAIDVKTGKEMVILHGVSCCRLTDDP